MNPSVDVGARRDPLGICAWRSIAHRILVRVELPFILHWFKNRLPAITNPAGRLSDWMLGKSGKIGKGMTANSWQAACNESNAPWQELLAKWLRRGTSRVPKWNVPGHSHGLLPSAQ